MNDSKDKVRPSIFYATKPSSSPAKRTSDRGDGNHKNRRPHDHSANKNRGSKDRKENSRIETFNAYSTTSVKEKTSEREQNHSSPWQKKISEVEQTPTFNHEEYRKQKKGETVVYSENSCKAVFKHRKTAIVKAFITQEMSYHFKDLIKWLVHQHLGYDIVTNEQLTKIAETPHHGGIALIIKKRQPILLTDYLQRLHDQHDHILAIDDINNPHNLGGLMRTAAFYGINGVLLRQPTLLDSGAAMRVSEGGTEAITPIKSDDLVASLDRLKEANYKIVALLPCQMRSLNAKALNEITSVTELFGNKTAIVLFQQINMELIRTADEIIYLKGNENMAALNISVAAGIVLSQLSLL